MAKEIFKTRERMILVMKWDNLIILQEVLNDLGVTYDIRYSKDDTVKLVTVKLNLPNFMVVESILKKKTRRYFYEKEKREQISQILKENIMEQDDGVIHYRNWHNYSSCRWRLYVFTFYIGIWRTAVFC